MVRKKNQKRTKKVSAETSKRIQPYLENLKDRLSSPRLRAPGTISSYLETGQRFLSGLDGDREPTDSDFRRYFTRRREQGISERTLLKEFFHLKKLALANKWPWPFTPDDAPYPEEVTQLPFLEQAEIEQMIKARAKLSKAERFYLAVATTWIVRREELSRIKKRDYDENSIILHTAKHGKMAKHLIPDCLKPVFADYRAKEHSPISLTGIFKRICEKAGFEHKPRTGWHSIRYTLNTLLKEVYLPQNRQSPSLLDDYAHWKVKTGGRYAGGNMTEYYRRPELVYKDPSDVDRIIYSIHPFLPLWEKKR
ncbi:MAG: hypothetical protein AUK00_01690 [Dehalococcoidia bacterium CG2_30_46_9]|nr:MAG: hypothetical protein AUK00_01690 [Dehalococcoidia bacterium CG2_30_46_9]